MFLTSDTKVVARGVLIISHQWSWLLRYYESPIDHQVQDCLCPAGSFVEWSLLVSVGVVAHFHVLAIASTSTNKYTYNKTMGMICFNGAKMGMISFKQKEEANLDNELYYNMRPQEKET